MQTRPMDNFSETIHNPAMRPMPKLLSKTKIMRGYRCPKSIYLTIHQPELEPPVGPAQQAVFDQGNLVGELARSYYPGGILVENKPWDFGGSLKRTRELMKEGAEFIYEAAFEYKGCYARADILKHSKESGRWTLLEVKSGTKVKSEYLDDVGLQAWIIANSGLQLEKICIVHLNPECRYPNLKNLFIEADVTDQLRDTYRDIAPRMNAIFGALRTPHVPDMDIGPHCVRHRDCEFKNHCFTEKGIPSLSVFNIPRLGDKVWEYYKSGHIELKDVSTQGMTDAQKRIVHAHVNKSDFLSRSGVQESLATWNYPFVFLDFETINPAIPCYPGTAPYQHTPFQFSAHVQRQSGSPLEHREYLHDDGTDPRPGLISALLDACEGQGTIVAYYAKFEIDRIQEMAACFPEYAERLMALVPRFADPLEVMRAHVYHQAFGGSYSLKSVAPALLGKDYSYDGLAVPDGLAAQRAFKELILMTDPDRRAKLRAAMLEYCAMDTLAMVKVVDWLRANSVD